MTPSEWDHRDFAAWVRRELRRREWTDSDFARRLNLSTGTVSRWLSGDRHPNPRSCDLI
jgi:transcriptional regulator with XRE-family HTH domain